MRLMRSRLPGGQRGYTLVEVSVATLIAAFLIGGLLTVVQDNRRAFSNQSQLAQLQDAERMAMTMIANVVQSAGYFPNPTANQLGTVLLARATPTMAAGQYLAGTGAWTAAAPGDQITVRYATGGPAGGDPNRILTCDGNYNTTSAMIVYTSTFSVSNGQLVCTLQKGSTAATAYGLVGGAGTTVTVTNLQVRYGVIPAGATNNSPAQYLDATAVPDWTRVASVLVTLTFTPLPVGNQAALPPVTFSRVITLNNAGGISS